MISVKTQVAKIVKVSGLGKLVSCTTNSEAKSRSTSDDSQCVVLKENKKAGRLNDELAMDYGP